MIDPRSLKDPSRYALDRRSVLLGGAAALSASSIAFQRAYAAETLTIADPGGAWTPACDDAFVKPFEKEAGVSINHIAREHYPTVEIKANVETKSYTWDAVVATDADVYELAPQNLLEPLDWSGEDMGQIMDSARKPGWMGQDTYATVICYNTDKYKNGGPKNWADFWNVQKFPGRRAMHGDQLLRSPRSGIGHPTKPESLSQTRNAPAADAFSARCRSVVVRKGVLEAAKTCNHGAVARPKCRAEPDDVSGRTRSRAWG